jgi:hypothetical protein
MAFWRMLKQGYDHFEVTRLEPKVDVCDRHYVFNAESSGKFSPAEGCPAYSVREEIASAVRTKARRDDSQIAQLVARGVPAVASTTGGQGGMNATFLAALKANGGPGSDIRTASGTIPGHVHPPAEPSPGFSAASLFGFISPAPKPAQVQITSAAPSSDGKALGRIEPSTATAKRAQTAAAGIAVAPGDAKPADSKKVTVASPRPAYPQKTASAEPDARPVTTGSLLSGAVPTMPAGSFGFSR